MAIKPTIYKLRIALSDLERNYYDTLNLTVALHPSETPERMMARVMAFCLNAQPGLVFTKGLSAIDEPDIWVRSMDEQTELWIDIGEPAFDRLKKATRRASKTKVYTFNTKSDVWWEQGKGKFSQLAMDVTRFDWSHICGLTEMLQRTMDWSITITGQTAYVASGSAEAEVSWSSLQSI